MNILLIILTLGLPLSVFVTFADLLEIEYENFRKDWDADGKPIGYFWKPINTKMTSENATSYYRCMYSWLFKSPSWIKSSERAKKLILIYRFLVIILNVGVIVFFATSFFLAYIACHLIVSGL